MFIQFVERIELFMVNQMPSHRRFGRLNQKTLLLVFIAMNLRSVVIIFVRMPSANLYFEANTQISWLHGTYPLYVGECVAVFVVKREISKFVGSQSKRLFIGEITY